MRHGRGALGGVEDRLRLLQRLVERHVAVPPVEGLRRGEVEVDPVERGLAQALVALEVEDEARVFGAVAPLDPRHNLLGPRHPRNAVVPDEADRLDARQPGRSQPVDELGPHRGCERLRLVLEAVAGPDVTNRHHGRKRYVATRWPG